MKGGGMAVSGCDFPRRVTLYDMNWARREQHCNFCVESFSNVSEQTSPTGSGSDAGVLGYEAKFYGGGWEGEKYSDQSAPEDWMCVVGGRQCAEGW